MNEDEKHLQLASQSSIGLLDLMLLVSQNLKLLIFGPLAISLLALALCFVVPQKYASEAIVVLPAFATLSTGAGNATPADIGFATAQAAAVMMSPLVLDSVIQSLDLAEGRALHVARRNLAERVRASVGKDGLLRLETIADSPQSAQALANAVIDTWLKSTIPGNQEKADMERRLQSFKTSLSIVEQVLDRLGKEGVSSLNQPVTKGEAGVTLMAIGELHARYLGDVLTLPRRIQGLSRDVVKQPPTLPTEVVFPKKGIIAILTAVGSGLLLLFWVFLREVWRSASRIPEVALKQARLLSSLGLRRFTS
jgi:capsular polysaccharide biosynthesis protein